MLLKGREVKELEMEELYRREGKSISFRHEAIFA
jgi:hypothetical protein